MLFFRDWVLISSVREPMVSYYGVRVTTKSRLGIDEVEAREMEERATSENSMTNITIKGGSGQPVFQTTLRRIGLARPALRCLLHSSMSAA